MKQSVSRPVSIRDRSKITLIEVAERLMSEHGIEGVSLRQITTEAGHRNPAAVQYHFGSKEGLLRAIVEYRLPPLNARRLELLDKVGDAPKSKQLRLLVEAIVRPLAELDTPGSQYVEFLARLTADARLSTAVFNSVSDDIGLSGRLVADTLHALLEDHLPAGIAENRRALVMMFLVSGLASHRHGTWGGGQLSEEEFLADLIDAGVGLLAAPASTRATTPPNRPPRARNR